MALFLGPVLVNAFACSRHVSQENTYLDGLGSSPTILSHSCMIQASNFASESQYWRPARKDWNIASSSHTVPFAHRCRWIGGRRWSARRQSLKHVRNDNGRASLKRLHLHTRRVKSRLGEVRHQWCGGGKEHELKSAFRSGLPQSTTPTNQSRHCGDESCQHGALDNKPGATSSHGQLSTDMRARLYRGGGNQKDIHKDDLRWCFFCHRGGEDYHPCSLDDTYVVSCALCKRYTCDRCSFWELHRSYCSWCGLDRSASEQARRAAFTLRNCAKAYVTLDETAGWSDMLLFVMMLAHSSRNDSAPNIIRLWVQHAPRWRRCPKLLRRCYMHFSSRISGLRIACKIFCELSKAIGNRACCSI